MRSQILIWLIGLRMYKLLFSFHKILKDILQIEEAKEGIEEKERERKTNDLGLVLIGQINYISLSAFLKFLV